ncbi:MAG: serine hydrolase [Planctomycetaceae bacterium]|nr:serine hydrolase [Planctomycetaceae bacterium]
MRSLYKIFSLCLLFTVTSLNYGESAEKEIVFPSKTWETRTPEEVDLDSELLDQFAKKVGGDGVIIRDGYLVISWGNPQRRRDWASSTKPVVATLLMFAVQEKKLESPDDLIRPWVQRRWPDKDLIEKDRTMTFRHLADMTSGYNRGESPGSHWAYNDYGIMLYIHMMVEVFQSPLDNVVMSRLAPLEFEDGGIFGSRGGNGVDASPRDFARIGWFWLNHGNWSGEQLLPRDIFDQCCQADVPADLPRTQSEGTDYLRIGTLGGGPDQSGDGPGVYGYNWWFNSEVGPNKERFMPHLPPDAFQANGHWGKECMLMIPSENIVIAARGRWGGTKLEHAKLIMQANLRGK